MVWKVWTSRINVALDTFNNNSINKVVSIVWNLQCMVQVALATRRSLSDDDTQEKKNEHQ